MNVAENKWRAGQPLSPRRSGGVAAVPVSLFLRDSTT
jgi:hypothetical protein